MFGHFVKSTLSVGGTPWPAVVAIGIPALLFFAWDARKHWRQGWWYWVVLFVLLACAWRLRLHVGSKRYYSVLVVPGILLIFHMFWNVAAAKWRKISLAFFSVVLAACVVRDFRGNRQEFKVISLDEKAAADTKKQA